MNLIHIIDCYYWIWIQSAIDNERDYEAPMQMLTTEKYIAAGAALAAPLFSIKKKKWREKKINLFFNILPSNCID